MRCRATWAFSLALVAFVVVVMLRFFPLALLVSPSTPTGGDIAAHIWFPRALASVFPHISGWSDDWFAGFPVGVGYFPLPGALSILVGSVVGFPVGFKLVVFAAACAVPLAAARVAWVLSSSRAVTLAALGATLAFQLEEFHTIYGGNLSSVLAGMFSFSLGFAFALTTVAVVATTALTGRRPSRVLPVLMLATVLSHLLAAAALVLFVAAVFIVFPHRARSLRLMAVPFAIGVLGSLWWVLPFVASRSEMTSMGYAPTRSLARLFPPFTQWPSGDVRWWFLVGPLALVAFVVALARRDRVVALFAVFAVLSALLYLCWPPSAVWDARWLPLWWWSLWSLAAVGLVRALAGLAPLVRRAGAAIWLLPPLLATGWFAGLPVVRDLPTASPAAPRAALWGQWFASGFEAREAWDEFSQLVAVLDDQASHTGCGRVLWEFDQRHDIYGSTMALMSLPYWTDGCVDSLEGLFMEGSATTPFVFLAQDMVSSVSSRAVRGLPYEGFDMDRGVGAMRALGARWFVSFNADTRATARMHPGLIEVATVGPRSVFAVRDATLVSPIAPSDIELVSRDDLVALFARDPSALGVVGPSWLAELSPASPPPAAESTVISEVVAHLDGSVSFRVSEPGVPVLVRSSFFPTWRLSGARGPFRASGNMMVVVPTEYEVRLETPVPPWRTAGEAAGAAAVVAFGGYLYVPRRGRLRSGRCDQRAG